MYPKTAQLVLAVVTMVRIQVWKQVATPEFVCKSFEIYLAYPPHDMTVLVSVIIIVISFTDFKGGILPH